MRDRKFYLFLLILFAAFSLTACGSGGDDTTTTSGTAVPGGGGAPGGGGGSGSWTTGVLQSGSGSTDYAIGMVKDTSGNIYILGYTDGNMDGYTNLLGPWDIFLIKYDSSGVKQWTKMLQSDRDDRPFAIAYDGSDGIYITGYTSGDMDSTVNPDDGEHLFISKFTTGGSRVWTKLYETAVTSKGYGIACYDGNVYVTGTGFNVTEYNLFLAKYDGAGNQVWFNYYSGTSSGETIALDASGNIYVAGTSTAGMVLYKFNPSGTEIWHGVRADYYIGRGLVLDSSANLYFTGSTNTWHAFLAKYDKDGNLVWENPIESLSTEGGNAVTLDGSGNIYVIGGTRGDLNGEINHGNYDLFLIKYYPGGKLAWTTLLGTDVFDAGAALVMQGEYILTYGHTTGVLGSSSLGGQDYFFARFDSPSGTLQ